MVNFKEIYHFSRFQRGPTFSGGGGGVQLFPGGSNCLFPIETQITCDFPEGSGPPVPRPGSALAASATRTTLQTTDGMVYYSSYQIY